MRNYTRGFYASKLCGYNRELDHFDRLHFYAGLVRNFLGYGLVDENVIESNVSTPLLGKKLSISRLVQDTRL